MARGVCGYVSLILRQSCGLKHPFLLVLARNDLLDVPI